MCNHEFVNSYPNTLTVTVLKKNKLIEMKIELTCSYFARALRIHVEHTSDLTEN